METAEAERATKLLAEAKAILEILRINARRPFVLEVTGTPKAGKTSTLGLIHGFFRRAGFRVRTLSERAAICPLPMKGHFFFNAWTTCTMLAEVLANYDTDADLIILDRGFFDALIWLRLQTKRGQVDLEEAATFTSFVNLKRWRRLVDLTLVMTATPEKAMEREFSGSLLPRTGSLMNPQSLQEFNEIVGATIRAYSTLFKIKELDTTENSKSKETAILSLEELLPEIRQWGEHSVVVVPRAVVEALFKPAGKPRPFLGRDQTELAWASLQEHMRLELRHKVEKDDTLVQIVGCGIVTHEESLFLLTRAAEDEKASYGRSTLWKGCHIEGDLPMSLTTVAAQVKERVLEELHLIRTVLETRLLGMVWDEDGRESRHMGILFLASIDDAFVARSLQDKEFRKAGRGHVMNGKFHKPVDILSRATELDLERWSQFAVNNFGLEEPL